MSTLTAWRSRNPNSRRVHLQEQRSLASLCALYGPWVSGNIRPGDYICQKCAGEARLLGLAFDEKEILGQ